MSPSKVPNIIKVCNLLESNDSNKKNVTSRPSVNGISLINASDGEMFKEISMMEMFMANWQISTSYVSVSV